MAMNLDPAVIVGRAGITPTLLKEANAALARNEIIKVRFADADRSQRKELAAEFAEQTRSELCGIVGQTASYYRPHRDPEQRIKL